MDDNWTAVEQEWRDPANWRAGWLGIYVAPRDPRVVVRKREPRLGWTFNYAHRASWYWTFGSILVALLAMALAIWAQGS